MEYTNQFNLNNELQRAINLIISKYENDLSLEMLDITIPEHTKYGPTIREPFTFASIGMGGLRYSTYYKDVDTSETIPEKKFHFLVVIKKANSLVIPSIHFESYSSIEKTLNNLTELYVEYDGIFNCNIFYKKFPYLKTFFDYLNNYREKNNRVTIDKDVIKQAIRVTLQNNVKSDLTLN